MDIGALLQCVAGDTQVAKGLGRAGQTNPAGNWQSYGEMPADHETTSFMQAVQQILNQADGPGDSADDGESTHQDPSDALSQLGFLLERVQQGAAESGRENDSTPSITQNEGLDPQLLAALNLGLAEGQNPLVDTAAKTSTGIDSDLLALLNEKRSALEPLTHGSAADVNVDARKATLQALVALKTALGQDPEPSLDQPLQKEGPIIRTATDTNPTAARQPNIIGDAIVDSATASKNIAANDHGQNAGMATHPTANGQPDAMANAMALKNQAPLFAVPKKSASTNRSQPLGSDAAVQTNPDPPDHPVNTAKSLVQATPATEDAKIGTATSMTSPAQGVMPQSEITRFQQKPNQLSSMPTAEKSQGLEGAGLKSDSVKEGGTATPQAQTAISSQALDERLSVNEQNSVQNARQHQILENEPVKPTLTDAGRSEPDMNASTNLNLSDALSANKTPLASMESRPAPAPVSEQATFQKAVMDQIVEKATLRSLSNRSEMHIQLKPDVLGDVRMRIVAEKNQLIVQMVADKPEAKEIIESQIHHLRAELDKQGLTVGKIEVTIGAGNDQQDNRGQFNQMFKNHPENRGKGQDTGDQPESAFKHQPPDDKDTDSQATGINYFV